MREHVFKVREEVLKAYLVGWILTENGEYPKFQGQIQLQFLKGVLISTYIRKAWEDLGQMQANEISMDGRVVV